jgi:alpha-glucosidase (family GH31 glycosyl hydrolase)
MDSDLGVLAAQIGRGLSSAMCGFPFRAPDVGGHFSSITTEDCIVSDSYTYTGGQTRSTEVYLRWVQCYAFNSMMWAHGHPWRSKLPWIRGPVVEAIVRKYIELRYRLLPYIYTHAWRACTTGAPFIRALVLDYPDDPNVYDLDTQFLLGHDVLVAPVLREGAKTWDVYLPAGEWYDFWTHERTAGGRQITVGVDLAGLLSGTRNWEDDDERVGKALRTVPVYIRAGAILPLGPVVQYASEKPLDPITLWVYPAARSAFQLYEDDGVSYAYEQGEYALTDLRCQTLGNGTIQVSIGKTRGSFAGMLEKRSYVVRVRSAREPERVVVDGQALPKATTHPRRWWYDDTGFAVVELCHVSDRQHIQVEYE